MRPATLVRSVCRSRLVTGKPQRNLQLAQQREFSTTLFFGGRRPFLSLLFSGITLGAGVTLPIAAWYHFSGIKDAVDTAQVTLSEINQSREKVQRKGPSNKPSDALAFLRIAAKTYVHGIPFAPWAVDKAFDSVEATIDAHQEEAGVIIENLGRKMAEIVEHHKTVTAPAAWELLGVVREETAKLHQVAIKAVDPAVAKSVQDMAGNALHQAWKTTDSVGKGAVQFVKRKLAERKGGDGENNEKKDD